MPSKSAIFIIIYIVCAILLFIIYYNLSNDNFRNRKTGTGIVPIYFNYDIYSITGSVGNPNIIHGPGCQCGCEKSISKYGNSNYVNPDMSAYFKQYINQSSF